MKQSHFYMNIKCSKTISFTAAHRIINHSGKCKYLHGHSYTCEAIFSAQSLDDSGMVIDFGIIKDTLGHWINTNLDHNTILCKDDTELIKAIESNIDQKIYVLDKNPTAENIALHILHDICPMLFKDYNATCCKIVLHESSTSYAEVEI